jgi:hypothetical protein
MRTPDVLVFILRPVLRLLGLSSGPAHPNSATAQFPERAWKVLVCGLGRNTACFWNMRERGQNLCLRLRFQSRATVFCESSSRGEGDELIDY